MRKNDKYDAKYIEILKKFGGAIPIARTNLTQLVNWIECESFWGRISNPFQFSRRSGGSSGGCGNLVAVKGTPISIATDSGGSIRIPAVWNGVVGFKVSPIRGS